VGRIKNLFSKVKKIILSHKVISIIIFVILLIIGFILFPKSEKQVLTQDVKKGDVIKTVSVTGKIASDNYVDLTFQTGGTLAYLGVKKGDTVKAYQTIATLDQRTVQKNLQIALATYAQTRNSFDATKESYNDTPSQDATSNEMRRILENNQYDLNKAVTSVELSDLARQQSILITPISGIITRTDVLTTGVNITPTTVFTVTDPSSLSFNMEVDEADIGRIKPGQQVNLSLDSFPDQMLKLSVSEIDFVNHTTSSGGSAYYVKTSLPQNESYRVGMGGNADIIISSKRNVLYVQSSDIFDDHYIYVKKNNKFEKRKLQLGLQSDTEVEVLSGLSVGDIVVLDPGTVPPNQILK
jgi:RND family efflux transporter MFP subunit